MMLYKSTYNQPITITVCARASNLSLIQVNEVLLNIRQYYPCINFKLTTFLTPGDQDLKTVLTSPDLPNNFFTKNLDDYILEEKYHIAIHSAKDVPSPLPSQLEIIALTKSISEIDCLLFSKENTSLYTQQQTTIGTSSLRRKETLQKIFPKWKTKNIRGCIEERINLIHKKVVDGIVVAKAALIRLNLLNKYTTIDLPPPYAPLQGSLAIVAKCNAFYIKEIFSKIDTRYENVFSRTQ